MAKWIVYLFFVTCLTSVCNADEEYECDDVDTSVIYYKGTPLVCPPKKVCNKYHVGPDPCTDPSENCYSQFTCPATAPGIPALDPRSVNIDGKDFLCPSDFICNIAFEGNCEPCIRKPCGPQFYKCEGESTVIIPNLPPMTCEKGSVCNKDNAYPCDACINLKTKKAARFYRF